MIDREIVYTRHIGFGNVEYTKEELDTALDHLIFFYDAFLALLNPEVANESDLPFDREAAIETARDIYKDTGYSQEFIDKMFQPHTPAEDTDYSEPPSDNAMEFITTGVKITGEHLEAFGFTFIEERDCYHYELTRQLHGIDIPSIQSNWFGKTSHDKSVQYVMVDCCGEYRYLHELREIWYALTRTEIVANRTGNLLKWHKQYFDKKFPNIADRTNGRKIRGEDRIRYAEYQELLESIEITKNHK